MTRILQEKAEALKKKRQSAEALQKEAEESVGHLEALGITLAEVAGRTTQLRELARRSDWDGVEIQSKALLEYLASHVSGAIEDRRRKTVETVARMTGAGIAVAPEDRAELEALAHPAPDAPWLDTASRLVRLEEILNKAGAQNVCARPVGGARGRRLGRSFGRPKDRVHGAARTGSRVGPGGSSPRFAHGCERDAPGRSSRGEAPPRYRPQARRGMGRAREGTRRFHCRVEEALRADLSAGPERSAGDRPDPRHERSGARRGAPRADRDGAGHSQDLAGCARGVRHDTGPARAVVEDAMGRLPGVPADEIPHLLESARTAAEEPIVAVVASLLDEVRPRINQARRLGRDPSEVFAAMNRAREALRLRIYSEALAASQEAAERVGQLTEDLEAARDELQTLEEMLARFHKAGFLPDEFDTALTRVRGHLDRVEVGPARELLRDTVVRLGRETLRFFQERWETLDRVREYAQERGFLSDEAARRLTGARGRLDAGDLATGAEELSQAEVELRNASVPYVARRVEEMEQGLGDIPDDSLAARCDGSSPMPTSHCA